MKMTTVLYIGVLAALGVAGVGVVFGDDDGHRWIGFAKTRQDVARVNNDLYAQECGSCHFTYQPGLLPAATWTEIMQRLDDHFGENAELPKQQASKISDYLTANAADRAEYSRFAGIGRSMDEKGSLRITDTAYFRRKHHEVPERMVRENPKLGSFARCEACHPNASKGNYDEHQVRIPGGVRWDD